MIRLALLADPHLHDDRMDGRPGGPHFRSLADTRESTRVFNESGAALRSALDGIAAEGIDLCLIAGDLTDDGQPGSWRAAVRMLEAHSARHGTRFLACPGNHDQWGPAGKPLAKEFVDREGQVATFAATGAAGTLPCPGMRMSGYAEALGHGGRLGYRRDPRDLLWETPFGRDDSIRARSGHASSAAGDGAAVPDLSYLVEPVEGLWLLSLDANVYLPDGAGAFADCSTLGWSAALRHKPWLLPWVEAVVARAGREGKELVAFSHYPVTDIFSGTIAELDRLGGPRAGRRRMPSRAESAEIAATGLRLHLSGHWHVDAVSIVPGAELVNVSLPSTAGFPAGWKIAELGGGGCRIHDRPLREAEGFDCAAARYRAEAARTGQDPALGEARDYGEFLDRHFRDLVLNRRLAEDWPGAMRALLSGRVGDLPGGAAAGEAADLPMSGIFLDWYRLREAGGGAAAAIPDARRQVYAALARGAGGWPEPCATFFRTLGLHLAAGPAGQEALKSLGACAEAAG